MEKIKMIFFPKTILMSLLIIISFYSLNASVHTASSDFYEQNTILTMRFKNASIKEIFSYIESNSEFIFFYQNEILDAKKKVDINVKNQQIQDVLNILLSETNIVYEINDRQISLKKEIPAPVSPVVQQRKTVRGKVLDSSGETLPGAAIIVEGSTRGVTTDMDGTFSIEVENKDKLVVSFLGMESQTIPVGNQTEILINLKEKTDMLEEVTVVAFAKQKKESLVASITTVKPAELKVPSSNLTTALAGRMSGLISYQRSGEPGLDNAEFFIRGVTTFGYKKDPLILIDNNESSSTELSRLQPDDIASFSIMKDATATALYGSRGANGVILVTTKSGVEGKMKLNIRFEEALSQPTKLPELADPVTYMLLHNESVRTRNPLGRLPYSQNKIDHTIAGDNPYVYPANDWYNMLLKDVTNNHRLNFSVNGGGKVATYYVSGSVINDNGILKVDKKNNFNNNVSLNRYMLRSNVNINLTPTTEMIARLSGAFDDYTGPIGQGSEIFRTVMKSNPVLFPAFYAPDEKNGMTSHILFGNASNDSKEVGYINPYAEMVKGYKESSTSQINVQFELKQKLDFWLKGLEIRAMFNTSRYAYFDKPRAYKPFYYDIASYDRPNDSYVLSQLNKDGEEWLSFTESPKTVNSTTYFEGAINWANTFDVHDLSGLFVYTLRDEKRTQEGNDLQLSLPYRNIGLAGRVTYGYDKRYLAELNFGYNGSERFSKKERFGFFPSAGLGWIISNEAFYSDGLKKYMHNLKLKATYGLSGNDAIGSANDRFFYLSNVNMSDGNRRTYFGTMGRKGGEYRDGITISRYANDLITWEEAKKMNLTLEAGFFGSLDLQAEVYKEERSNILMTRASTPSTMGLQSEIRANVGEAKAKGVDLSLNLNHAIKKDWFISGMANFTYATSEFSVYEEPNYPNAPWKSHIGYSLNQNWGYIAEYLFVDEEEVRNSPEQFGEYGAGDIKYKDLNGDGKITELDMAPIGYPTVPEITYGFGLSTEWKKWDFSFFFQGSARQSFWISSGTMPFINGGQEGATNALLKAYADDYWSEDNRNPFAILPRLSSYSIENNEKTSNWWMRDGSFLRLKSVEFGYSLPETFIKRAGMSNLRVYFSGTNLLTFSKFKLWDPEMAGDGLGYPVQRVFNLGVQLGF